MTRPEWRRQVSALFTELAFCTVVSLCLAACSQQKSQPFAEKKATSNPTPKTTRLSELKEEDRPRVIQLDTVPKPSVVFLPNKNKAVVVAPQRKQSHQPDSLLATQINEAEGRGFFSTLTTDDGLTLDQVYCSYKDKWGNLWFGTNGGGVSKYDGKNFTTYKTSHGLAGNIVWCITQDHEDNLWFGTDGDGLSKYDGQSFTNYTTAQGLADDVILSITEDKQKNLWMGTLKGVSRWDGKKFTNYTVNTSLSNNAVKTIFEDSHGDLWFGTLGGGVSKWNRTGFTNYTTKDGLIGDRIFSIAEDNTGNIWFGADGRGVSRYDGKIFTNYALFNAAAPDVVLCITNDKNGALWFGTENNGAIKYDGNIFSKYSTDNGLANNHIRAITKDEKSNLWFSSFGSGICKFAGSSFTNFTTAQGLSSNVVFSMDETRDGSLWLGTSGGGVCRYNGKQVTNFTKTDGLPRNEIYSVFEDRNGNLWFGTSGSGVCRYDGKAFTTYTTTQGLAANIVFSIAEDKTGNLWFGTSGGGVSKFDGKSFTNYTKLQGLAGDVVFGITEDRNANLWFGTLGDGISRFDGNAFTNYTVEQGLSDNLVWAITEDASGNLWVGTQQGLSLLPKEKISLASQRDRDAGSSEPDLFTNFSKDDGLPDNFITQVVQGEGQKLYVGTNLGLCEWLPVKNESSSASRWRAGKVFNSQHGYPVKDVNAGLNAMFKDSKGVIWIGTGSDKTGLVRFEPDVISANVATPPELFVNRVRVNNEAISWHSLAPTGKETDSASVTTATSEEVAVYGRKLTGTEKDSLHSRFAAIQFNGISNWQALPQQLVLPYYFNNVSFDFGVVETGQNFLVNYKYFLEGYDKEWSPPGRNTTATFGNISEGHYTLFVMAQSPDGVWGAPVSYSFTVLPPWWRTWWMFALYAALIVVSVFLFTRWRHRRIIRQKEILEHKVSVATKQVREETEKVSLQKKQIEDTLNELKATQAQLIQSEKMASLGELTAGIAHEIQNPLNFVNNFSEVSNELIDEMKAEMENGDTAEAKAIADDIKQNLKKINAHGKRADAIVKGMMRHSSGSIGQKELTNINALTDQYLRLAYHGLKAKEASPDITLKTEYDKNVGQVAIIQQDIGRVILNLVTNAFYAVAEKKKRSGDKYEPTVTVTTKKKDDRIEIRVQDNGDGIPKQIIDKVFQPFFTTKPTGQGTGLGLSLAYDIAKAHSGELSFETKEGETIFIILLPV